MSKEWKMVRLEEVLTQVSRSERVDPAKEYKLLGVRLDGAGPFMREVKRGSESAATTLNAVATGDFIYSRLFAWRGAFGVIKPELDGCYVSNEFPLFTPNAERVDMRFLRYWFRLPSTLATVEADCTGSTPLTRNRFKEKFFFDMQIPLPPLSEQQRIVARIEELAGRIEEARRLRKEAVGETNAVIASEANREFIELRTRMGTKSFGSFDPHVTSGPRNWATNYSSSEFRFYRAQDIGPYGSILDGNKVFVTPPDSNQGRSARLENGDLVMVITGATVGRVAIYRDDCELGYVNQHVAICRLPQDVIDSDYALWGLRSPIGQEQLLGQRYGQGKPGLNLSNIRALELPFPPLPEQRRIVTYLDSLQSRLDGVKRLQAETEAELEALLPSVLDKAFRGEM